jgi:hypothetical protein
MRFVVPVTICAAASFLQGCSSSTTTTTPAPVVNNRDLVKTVATVVKTVIDDVSKPDVPDKEKEDSKDEAVKEDEAVKKDDDKQSPVDGPREKFNSVMKELTEKVSEIDGSPSEPVDAVLEKLRADRLAWIKAAVTKSTQFAPKADPKLLRRLKARRSLREVVLNKNLKSVLDLEARLTRVNKLDAEIQALETQVMPDNAAVVTLQKIRMADHIVSMKSLIAAYEKYIPHIQSKHTALTKNTRVNLRNKKRELVAFQEKIDHANERIVQLKTDITQVHEQIYTL